MSFLPPEQGRQKGRREGLLIRREPGPPRVLHVITGLGLGGAEMTLLALLRSLGDQARRHSVVSLGSVGPVVRRITELGCKVESLDMRGLTGLPSATARIRGIVDGSGIGVVHSWMYHACLVSGLALRRRKDVAQVWAVHNTNLDAGSISRSTRMVVHLCRRLSASRPQRIVYASEASRAAHEGIGYAQERSVVIPNGFILDEPVAIEARSRMRESLDIPADAPVIGLVARWDAQKDLGTMVEAVAALHRERPDAVVILCGDGLEWGNDDLRGLIEASGAAYAYRLLGPRDDTPEVMSAFDVATLSSKGESFPRVVAESMLLGIPNVVTDVGDCAIIVGETGRVVPPSDPAALSSAWLGLLSLPEEERRKLGQQARSRITERYGADVMRDRYLQVYQEAFAEVGAGLGAEVGAERGAKAGSQGASS